jgi:hypothetical protein
MTRKDVIRAMVERDLQKQPLSARCVRKELPELYRAAEEHFGNWETALQYAGICRQQMVVKTRYDRQRVCSEISRLCKAGYLLSETRSRKRNPVLYAAACRYFGTWRDAILASGVNPDHLIGSQQGPKPDRDAVLEFIRTRHREGHSLHWPITCQENQRMTWAAKYHFKNWRKAKVAAGVFPEPPSSRNKSEETNREDPKSSR